MSPSWAGMRMISASMRNQDSKAPTRETMSPRAMNFAPPRSNCSLKHPGQRGVIQPSELGAGNDAVGQNVDGE